MAGVYIHIPYCLKKCPYCDFNTYAVPYIPEQEYLRALLSELDYYAAQEGWAGMRVDTIYFGGGTPSLFKASSLGSIVESISRLFSVSPCAEITMEANPGSEVSSETLSEFKAVGVNRLSLGAQSLNDEVLRKLGRMHDSRQVVLAYEQGRMADFENINLDLMYGIQGQSLSDVKEDVIRYASLSPEHISCYTLTIEKGTPFYSAQKKGRLRLPEEDDLVHMMELVSDYLKEHHYRHYEISNFSKEGKESRHNSSYWKGESYLGLGAGAHSYLKNSGSGENWGKRWSNLSLPAAYIAAAVSAGRADSWSDALTLEGAMFEYFFLGLRRIAGVEENDFLNRFNRPVNDIFGTTLAPLLEEGLIARSNGRIALTRRGLLLADSVIENFALS